MGCNVHTRLSTVSATVLGCNRYEFHIGSNSHTILLPLQEDKQDFWGGSAFPEPVDSTAPQHQKLVEAGLTDKILAGSLFGDTSTGADSQMGVPMAKLGTAAQESAIPMTQQQQQQQQPPQSQPAAGASCMQPESVPVVNLITC